MHACNPEGQLYPGLHQEKCDQQVEGGDSAMVLCSREPPPAVLHPLLEPPTQEGHGVVGAGPEEGRKDDWRAGAHIHKFPFLAFPSSLTTFPSTLSVNRVFHKHSITVYAGVYTVRAMGRSFCFFSSSRGVFGSQHCLSCFTAAALNSLSCIPTIPTFLFISKLLAYYNIITLIILIT